MHPRRFGYIRNGMRSPLSIDVHAAAIRVCFFLCNFGPPLRGASSVAYNVAAEKADAEGDEDGESRGSSMAEDVGGDGEEEV